MPEIWQIWWWTGGEWASYKLVWCHLNISILSKIWWIITSHFFRNSHCTFETNISREHSNHNRYSDSCFLPILNSCLLYFKLSCLTSLLYLLFHVVPYVTSHLYSHWWHDLSVSKKIYLHRVLLDDMHANGVKSWDLIWGLM